MSCLFDALAHALSARVGLLRHARYATIRGMAVPVTGASVRAALCDVMPSVRVHGATLAEWGAMETGTAPEEYARNMRAASTWGGGVEIAKYASHAAPIKVKYDGAHYTPT